MRDEHVSRGEKRQPCIATSNGTSNELTGPGLNAGSMGQQFHGRRYNSVPGWEVPGMVQCIPQSIGLKSIRSTSVEVAPIFDTSPAF